jgi:hypothetical protein
MNLSSAWVHEAVEVEPLLAPFYSFATGLRPRGAHTLPINGFSPSCISSWAHTALRALPSRLLATPLAVRVTFFESLLLFWVRLGVRGARNLRAVSELS